MITEYILLYVAFDIKLIKVKMLSENVLYYDEKMWRKNKYKSPKTKEILLLKPFNYSTVMILVSSKNNLRVYYQKVQTFLSDTKPNLQKKNLNKMSYKSCNCYHRDIRILEWFMQN